jgi:hypothetical protein
MDILPQKRSIRFIFVSISYTNSTEWTRLSKSNTEYDYFKSFSQEEKTKETLTFKSWFIKPSIGQSKSLYKLWHYFYICTHRLYLSLKRKTEKISETSTNRPSLYTLSSFAGFETKLKKDFPAQPKYKFPLGHVYMSLIVVLFNSISPCEESSITSTAYLSDETSKGCTITQGVLTCVGLDQYRGTPWGFYGG